MADMRGQDERASWGTSLVPDAQFVRGGCPLDRAQAEVLLGGRVHHTRDHSLVRTACAYGIATARAQGDSDVGWVGWFVPAGLKILREALCWLPRDDGRMGFMSSSLVAHLTCRAFLDDELCRALTAALGAGASAGALLALAGLEDSP